MSGRNVVLVGAAVGGVAAIAAFVVLRLRKKQQEAEAAKPTYVSTRGWKRDGKGIGFAEAVLMGLAPDGGLLVPTHLPTIPQSTLRQWGSMSFQQLAFQVMSRFIPTEECSSAELKSIIDRSYSTFRDERVTPVVKTDGGKGPVILELFHGPTFAFKDVALQFLGNMFEHLLSKKPEGDNHITVVGATSGDTGSSAIMGLRGKKGVDVFIMYPEGKVSAIQEAQMTTVLDANIHNCAIEGTFDDAQAIVKACFNDLDFRHKHHLAAVNSINWCRIMAQIVYYFYSYFRINEGVAPENWKPVSFSVPTGNFGDILAGYYAKRMGCPIVDLVVATNENDILHRFFSKGEYHKGTYVKHTNAPSMDIGVSSNFERFLFHMLDDDPEALKSIMQEFESSGKLGTPAGLVSRCSSVMKSARLTEGEVLCTIRETYKQHGYLLDPHSAIGVGAAEQLRKAGKLPSDDVTTTVCLACAHWGKFPGAVGKGIGEEELAKVPAPELLTKLLTMESRKKVMAATEKVVREYIEATVVAK